MANFSADLNRMLQSDWNGQRFPTPGEFKSWKLPAGTIIVAIDSTVIYPTGLVESWTKARQRSRIQVVKE